MKWQCQSQIRTLLEIELLKSRRIYFLKTVYLDITIVSLTN